MSYNPEARERAAITGIESTPGGTIVMDVIYAPSELRDRFLNALDAKDASLCHRLAADLKDCKNPLPGMTCEQLGLPSGSTYGSAARTILGGLDPHIGIVPEGSADS